LTIAFLGCYTVSDKVGLRSAALQGLFEVGRIFWPLRNFVGGKWGISWCLNDGELSVLLRKARA